ncbi:MAG TPA: hypothetical protein VIF09_04350, partial [Polyangiaceae bacterium]
GMPRGFTPRKLLVASLGVGAISYGACSSSPIIGNLMGPLCADSGCVSSPPPTPPVTLDGGPLTCCAPYDPNQCGFTVVNGVCNACCEQDACGLPPEADGGCHGVLPCPPGTQGATCEPVPEAGVDAADAGVADGSADVEADASVDATNE